MVWWHKELRDTSAECFDYPHIWLGHEGTPVSQFKFALAKILGFVELDNGDTMVLIKSCDYTHHQTSVFLVNGIYLGKMILPTTRWYTQKHLSIHA